VKFAAGLFLVQIALGAGFAESAAPPEIVRISSTSGPEGTRLQITGKNLQEVTAVLFGRNSADFKLISAETLIAIVPHRTPTSAVTVVAPTGRASSPFPFVVVNDPRVPGNPATRPVMSTPLLRRRGSVRCCSGGIAIADTRVSRL